MNLCLHAKSRSWASGLAIQTIRRIKRLCVVHVQLPLGAEKQWWQRHKKLTSKEFTRETRSRAMRDTRCWVLERWNVITNKTEFLHCPVFCVYDSRKSGTCKRGFWLEKYAYSTRWRNSVQNENPLRGMNVYGGRGRNDGSLNVHSWSAVGWKSH